MSVREQNARTEKAMRGRAAERAARKCPSRLGGIACFRPLGHPGNHENDMGDDWRDQDASRD